MSWGLGTFPAWLSGGRGLGGDDAPRAKTGFGGARPLPDVVTVIDVTFEKGPLGLSLRQSTNVRENGRKMIVIFKWETMKSAPIPSTVRVTSSPSDSRDGILSQEGPLPERCAAGQQQLQQNEQQYVPGPVERSGNVLLGDELIAVNAQLIPSHDFHDTVEMLKAAFWPITLRFRRVVTEQQIAAAIRDPDPTVSVPARAAALRSIVESSDHGPGDGSGNGSFGRGVGGGGGDGPIGGGYLILTSIEARAAIAHNNRLLVARAAELDAVIARMRLAVDRHAEGSAAIHRELSSLPHVRQMLRESNAKLRAVGGAAGRIEALLFKRDARRIAANPFASLLAMASSSMAPATAASLRCSSFSSSSSLPSPPPPPPSKPSAETKLSSTAVDPSQQDVRAASPPTGSPFAEHAARAAVRLRQSAAAARASLALASSESLSSSLVVASSGSLERLKDAAADVAEKAKAAAPVYAAAAQSAVKTVAQKAADYGAAYVEMEPSPGTSTLPGGASAAAAPLAPPHVASAKRPLLELEFEAEDGDSPAGVAMGVARRYGEREENKTIDLL